MEVHRVSPSAPTNAGKRRRPRRVSLVLSDVDGTLVTDDKVLTNGSREAVQKLRGAGIGFAITSSRPPAGLRMLIEPLGIDTPVAAFNGGAIVAPTEPPTILMRRMLDARTARRAIDALIARDVDVWVFTADRWLLRDTARPYVAHELRTVQFPPVVTDDFGPFLEDGIGKIVGVSAEFDKLARCEAEMQTLLGTDASVMRSQAYYLDVTHPEANKGTAVAALSEYLSIPLDEIVTIGDGFNDIAMFHPSGFAIAMGNAAPAVQEAADVVTASNGEDGFARAVEHYLLHDTPPSGNRAASSAGGVRRSAGRSGRGAGGQHG
jgi:Cof subfamily protein (haloacid dehalogenase superfamily)